jgi:hypothetical protein
MTDPRRLIDGGNSLERSILESASFERTPEHVRRNVRRAVEIGLTGSAVAASASLVSEAAAASSHGSSAVSGSATSTAIPTAASTMGSASLPVGASSTTLAAGGGLLKGAWLGGAWSLAKGAWLLKVGMTTFFVGSGTYLGLSTLENARILTGHRFTSDGAVGNATTVAPGSFGVRAQGPARELGAPERAVAGGGGHLPTTGSNPIGVAWATAEQTPEDGATPGNAHSAGDSPLEGNPEAAGGKLQNHDDADTAGVIVEYSSLPLDTDDPGIQEWEEDEDNADARPIARRSSEAPPHQRVLHNLGARQPRAAEVAAAADHHATAGSIAARATRASRARTAAVDQGVLDLRTPAASVRPSAPSTLRVELEALGEVRSRLRSGLPSAALTLLKRYAEEYPNGALRPEAALLKARAERALRVR